MRRLALFINSLLVFCAGTLVCQAQSSSSGYKVVEKFKIGGDGGWDYLTVDTADHPRPRPTIEPGTFTILSVSS